MAHWFGIVMVILSRFCPDDGICFIVGIAIVAIVIVAIVIGVIVMCQISFDLRAGVQGHEANSHNSRPCTSKMVCGVVFVVLML